MIKLYEFPPTRSLRPLWMLQELGLEFEVVRADLTKGDHQQPAYRKINPAAKLPALVDGDVVLTAAWSCRSRVGRAAIRWAMVTTGRQSSTART